MHPKQDTINDIPIMPIVTLKPKKILKKHKAIRVIPKQKVIILKIKRHLFRSILLDIIPKNILPPSSGKKGNKLKIPKLKEHKKTLYK